MMELGSMATTVPILTGIFGTTTSPTAILTLTLAKEDTSGQTITVISLPSTEMITVPTTTITKGLARRLID